MQAVSSGLIWTMALLVTVATPIANAKPGNGKGQGAPAPILSFAADRASVTDGENVMLSWASADVKRCVAYGDWQGDQPTDGSYRTPPLHQSASFTLECNAPGGGITETVTVQVADATSPEPEPLPPAPEPDPVPAPEPVPAPSVSLSVADPTILSGSITYLGWSSTNAATCTASGGWSGDRPLSGNESVSPASTTTYTLSCSGDGGSDSASVRVTVEYPAPTLSFSAANTSVASGSTTTLSWNAGNADGCTASGGWSGSKPVQGTASTGSLETSTTFNLSCSGPGGIADASVQVAVEPAAIPLLSLTSNTSVVRPGETATLTWFGQSVSNCIASGAWTGLRSAEGVQTVGPLNQDSTFTLTCDSPSQTMVAVTTVLVAEGGATITWQRPTENVDGSPLDGLASFRIYVGDTPRNYHSYVEVLDPTAESFYVELLPGDYHMAMTALDDGGNESAYSNEIIKTVH